MAATTEEVLGQLMFGPPREYALLAGPAVRTHHAPDEMPQLHAPWCSIVIVQKEHKPCYVPCALRGSLSLSLQPGLLLRPV